MGKEKPESAKPPRAGARRACVAFGAFAILLAAFSVVGFKTPLAGAFLLAFGVVFALAALGGGIVFRSPQARRFACIAIAADALVLLAGTLAFFSNPQFEARCADALKEISAISDGVGEHLEND